MCPKNQIGIYVLVSTVIVLSSCYSHHHFHNDNSQYHHQSENDDDRRKLEEVFSWKQLSYDFNGKIFANDTNSMHGGQPQSSQTLADSEKFFVPYNNVPIGLEVYQYRVFVTVPRRRYGIPSTLNFITISSSSSSGPLKPYPGSGDLVSVYRPRVDECGRLWAVDTGLLEVPGERKQIQPPAIVIFDLKTNKRILKYELKPTDLIDERTPGGLTSISVEVSPSACDDAYAYITDLATEGLIVYSLKMGDSWRLQHDSFGHEESALNFSVAGYTIPWKDGLFSIALSNPDPSGKRVAFYHALASTREYSIETRFLKKKGGDIGKHVQLLGNRGPETQSGSHAYHGATKTLIFANVARDAILCWRVDDNMAAENVAVIAQDHEKLVYISDLKVIGDEVWMLVNKIPLFVYSTLNTEEKNFYIHRANIQDLIRGTACDRHNINSS